jgi:uncharacterized RDD family membrane protein YckC
MTRDLYIQSVIDQIPAGLPLRDQVAMELRAHFAERTAQGQPLDVILEQLGDPEKLAVSYLAAIPLTSASILGRLTAKLIDAGVVGAIVGTAVGVPALVLSQQLPSESAASVLAFAPLAAVILCVFGFVAYTVDQEYRRGGTVGKRMLGIHVVRESGARISLGQALLRQLPFFAQFFWLDALFALFTEKRQRAFELVTKTRVVALLFGLALRT